MGRTLVVALVLLAGASPAAASSGPIGPLPKPQVTSVQTTVGQLVSIALPDVAGKSWRVARSVNATVVRQVAEGDVGSTVVLVFKAVGKGQATITLALTRGETAKAYRAVEYRVKVT